ncbi:hypothetical protein AVEN_201764-1 [Araneus ventricosus]|uniref:Uncharacterized protein n=1 Tax=Araneus ventricosus TaxID=182803 RepID=A0A4Y2J1H3_ARAVE|nr:hypothetical protein AVEN_201764-1 [Araneus ventricosus]
MQALGPAPSPARQPVARRQGTCQRLHLRRIWRTIYSEGIVTELLSAAFRFASEVEMKFPSEYPLRFQINDLPNSAYQFVFGHAGTMRVIPLCFLTFLFLLPTLS